MLNYNEITGGKIIIFNNEPFKVLSHHVFRVQQRKPVNVTKLKSIISGKVVENSFHQTDKVKEADLETKKIVFIYKNKNDFVFSENNAPQKRFSLPFDIIGSGASFLKEKEVYEALLFNDSIISVIIPIKVSLKVMRAENAVKGNTSEGAKKIVFLETGASVHVPLFINEGDIIEINTENGNYTNRVEKA
jgi:elongation factor P